MLMIRSTGLLTNKKNCSYKLRCSDIFILNFRLVVTTVTHDVDERLILDQVK